MPRYTVRRVCGDQSKSNDDNYNICVVTGVEASSPEDALRRIVGGTARTNEDAGEDFPDRGSLLADLVKDYPGDAYFVSNDANINDFKLLTYTPPAAWLGTVDVVKVALDEDDASANDETVIVR